MSYPIVLVTAISGAVLGDNAGYWIGKKGGWPLLLRVARFFKIKEAELELARKKFSQNAVKAVFFGRFITLLRIFAGPLAGIVQMPYRQFLLYNVAGASVWALIMVSLAFILGKVISLETLLKGFSQFGLLALLLVLAWFLIPLVYRRLKKET